MRTASQEIHQPQIPGAATLVPGRKTRTNRPVLIEQRNAGIERQTLIGKAVAGDQGLHAGRVAGVGLAWRQGGGSADNLARIAAALAVAHLEAGHLARREGDCRCSLYAAVTG